MKSAPPLHKAVSRSIADTMLFLPMRRNHSRYPVQKIVSYHFEGRRFLTLTLDLGLGGMKIKTSNYIPGDQRLTSRLVLGKRSIQLEGRIVYSQHLPHEGSVSGVEFIDISERDRKLLKDYLSSLTVEPKGFMIHCRQEPGHLEKAASGM